MSPDFEYTIKLRAPALQVIATALQDAPLKLALPIITEIQRQVTEIEAAQAKLDAVDPPKPSKRGGRSRS